MNPTFFYQQIAAPPKAALDVVEPVRDYTPSTQIPPAFFEPEPLYFLEGIAAELDPLPITMAIPSVGGWGDEQNFPRYTHPSMEHIYGSLAYALVPFYLMPFLDHRTVTVNVIVDITTGDVLRIRSKLTEGDASLRTVADGSGLSVTLHEFT